MKPSAQLSARINDFFILNWHQYPKKLATGLIAFYLFNGISYLKVQSLTSEENSFWNYANRCLIGKPERISTISFNSKMPVIVLNTIPRIFN
ncbi:MAG: hypothetical protein WKF89_16330 [Chitinophagaceae bacterium]